MNALDMARWRRKPDGTVVHSDRGTQYVPWIFGPRLQETGQLGSTGAVACSFDNALMESFFSSMQVKLLDPREWSTRAELARAVSKWIEALYNHLRRHSGIIYYSPAAYQKLPALSDSVA